MDMKSNEGSDSLIDMLNQLSYLFMEFASLCEYQALTIEADISVLRDEQKANVTNAPQSRNNAHVSWR